MPQWINTAVIVEALRLKAQGDLNPVLDRWITDLLELNNPDSICPGQESSPTENHPE